MDKFLKKLNNLSLPVTIILASIILGGFYFASQMNKQYSIEKQLKMKIQQEKDLEVAEKKAKEQAEKSLDSCLLGADSDYSSHWYRECKSRGLISKNCLDLREMSLDQYMEKNEIPAEDRVQTAIEFVKKLDECSCSLPTYVADSVAEARDKTKDNCLERYLVK